MRLAIRNAIATLRAAEWMPMTAVRVLIGIFFCISGGTKLLVPAQFSMMEQTMAQSHIPFPHANALFVSLVEFVSYPVSVSWGSGCLDGFYQATGSKLGRSVASKFPPEAECERKFP
jgi:DoxX